MRIPLVRLSAVALAAGLTLGGCAYGPYDGLGVSVGYGSGYGYGYDPYYSGYSPYGYYGAGYRSLPYYGWYDGFYYPGTGYYVYDSYRRPYRWTDRQRAYWLQRQQAYGSTDRTRTLRSNWFGFRDRARTTSTVTTSQQPLSRTVRSQPERQSYQIEQRRERQIQRSEARQERREARSSERAATRVHERRDNPNSKRRD